MAITFVGRSGGSTTASGNNTPALPSGITEGDLLIAVIAYRGTAPFSVPAGWEVIAQESQGNTSSTAETAISSALVAYTRLGSSSPSTTFTRSGGDVALGHIFAYRSDAGQLTLGSFVATTQASNDATVSIAGVTTTEAAALVVAAVAGGPSGTLTTGFQSTDPASGSTSLLTGSGPVAAGTWRVRSNSTTATGADVRNFYADGVRATAGATGPISVSVTSPARHPIIAAAFKVGPAGSSPIAGSLSITEGADTAASTGAVAVAAALASVEAGDSVSGAAGLAISAQAAPIEAGDVLLTAGGLALSGVAALSDADDALSALGGLGLQGMFAAPEGEDGLEAIGGLTLLAALTSSEAGDTLSAFGQFRSSRVDVRIDCRSPEPLTTVICVHSAGITEVTCLVPVPMMQVDCRAAGPPLASPPA